MVLNDVKKLSPQERIKRLKEIAEKDKKEIEDAQKLIKESETEIEVEEKEKEQIPIPQLKATDISELTGQAKEMFKAKRYKSEKVPEEEKEEPTPLEETVEQEQITPEAKKEAGTGEYLRGLSTEQLTQKAEDLYTQAKEENFYLTREQQEKEENIYNELKRRDEDNINESYNQRVAEEINTGQRILKSLYKRD